MVLAISMVMIAPAVAVQTDSSSPSVTVCAQRSAAVPVLAATSGATMQPLSGSTKVYIARTGTKYHRYTCRYVKKSRIKKTLAWVKAHHYGACKVCKPPKR